MEEVLEKKPSSEAESTKVSSQLLPTALEGDDCIVNNILDLSELSKSPTGARPKDMSQIRRNRPNSLLGLSKPDLHDLVEPKDAKLALASESDIQNASEMLNRQRSGATNAPQQDVRASEKICPEPGEGPLLEQVPPAPFPDIPYRDHLIQPSTAEPTLSLSKADPSKLKTKRPSSLDLSERPTVVLSPTSGNTSDQLVPTREDISEYSSSPYSDEMSEPDGECLYTKLTYDECLYTKVTYDECLYTKLTYDECLYTKLIFAVLIGCGLTLSHQKTH